MEHAAQSDKPAANGYADKRRAVFAHVAAAEARAERYRKALAELVAALDAEAKAKAEADNALENFSNPGVYVREYEKAMVRAVHAMAAARAALAG
jgi:hypothetical protein